MQNTFNVKKGTLRKRRFQLADCPLLILVSLSPSCCTPQTKHPSLGHFWEVWLQQSPASHNRLWCWSGAAPCAHPPGLDQSKLASQGLTESLRLGKTSEITKTNCQPTTTMVITKSHPHVPYSHIWDYFSRLLGVVTPALPWESSSSA